MGIKSLEVKQSARAADGRVARRPQRPDLGMLPDLIGYQLRMAQRAIFADFAETVGADDISPGLFGILVVIGQNPGLTQQALANAAHLDRSSVVSVIDKLERRGLVSRRAADGRSNGLFLAAQGQALLRGLKRKVALHEQRVAQNLTAAERARLVSLLQRIFPERR